MDKPTGYATIGMLMAIAKNFAMRYGVTNIEDITLDPSGNGIQFILTTGDTITVPFDASELPFIPGSSGLTANNVQDAIYEVKEAIKIPCITGASDPTTATVGEVGQFYLNTTTNKLFQCQSAGGGSYIWGVPNVNAVTLGTETQNFNGNKNLILKSGNSVKFYSINTNANYISLAPLANNNNGITIYNGYNNYTNLQHGKITARLNGSSNDRVLSFPAKSGTLALTSDIPTLDSTPTQNSANGVTSGGVYQAIQSFVPSGINYLTTAPVADNTDGDLKIVVLSSEPATKYNGYLYIWEN